MLVKEIEYTDYNDNKRKEKFYFNLSKAEAMEWNMSEQGGLEQYIAKITAEQDGKRLVDIFKELILKTYGEKSLDGKKFVKSQELRDGFAQTEAYSQLFVELATNAEAAAAFINGIAPKQDTALAKN
jgi:hypothetical protein